MNTGWSTSVINSLPFVHRHTNAANANDPFSQQRAIQEVSASFLKSQRSEARFCNRQLTVHLVDHGGEDVEESANVAAKEVVAAEEVDEVLGQQDDGPLRVQLARDPLEPHGHAAGELRVGAEVVAAILRARPPRLGWQGRTSSFSQLVELN